MLEALEELPRLEQVLPFLTGTDQGCVGDNVRFDALVLEALEELECLGKVLSFLTGTDQAGVFPPALEDPD